MLPAARWRATRADPAHPHGGPALPSTVRSKGSGGPVKQATGHGRRCGTQQRLKFGVAVDVKGHECVVFSGASLANSVSTTASVDTVESATDWKVSIGGRPVTLPGLPSEAICLRMRMVSW